MVYTYKGGFLLISQYFVSEKGNLPEIEPSGLTDARADKKLPTKLKPVPGKSSCRSQDLSYCSDVEGEEDMFGYRGIREKLNVSKDPEFSSCSGFKQDPSFKI